MTPDPEPAHLKPRSLLPPALLRRPGAASLCGMGLSTFDRADATGLVPAGRKVGGCKVWCVSELRAWAAHGCPSRAEWEPIWQAVLATLSSGCLSVTRFGGGEGVK